ncbi:GNAT family N-acetyltransferase [Streptomyces orinoci]|uniref:GNAT family N-acetyltransferase n=1 Tax=Streptomyces orinoci TaxID=67339 RepID=A0ABV3JW91_STRON|nr:GNAT family N-acetyltransferase [Streptomyces orinoci]
MGMSVTIAAADEDDAEEILKLQYLCYQSEAELYGDYSLEPLTQSLAALRAELGAGRVLAARLGTEVVGSVRGAVDSEGTAVITGLIVHPRLRRHGLGGRLLDAIEEQLAAESAVRYRLAVGRRSEISLRLCRERGYIPTGGTERVSRALTLVTLEKPVAEVPALAASR